MQYVHSKIVMSAAILALAAVMAAAQDHGGGGSSSHSSGGRSSGSGNSGRGSGSGTTGGWHSYQGGSRSSSSSYFRGGSSSVGSRGGDFGGANHNIAAGGQTGHDIPAPTHIVRAPSAVFRPHPGGAAPAFEHGGLYRGGWREGYYHYNHFFHDDHFFFGFYVFDPFAFGLCVCSPWYYYPCLPPYLAYGHVIFVDTWYSSGWVGEPYTYYPDAPSRDNSPALDPSLHYIVAAFQDDDRRALSHLVPRDGKVNIFTEGNYSYSLSADDFYDLYKDGVENVHTDKYVIEDVQVNAKGDARVKARHEYTDPWGKPQTVSHTYYLAHEGSDYVIREFGTSYYDGK